MATTAKQWRWGEAHFALSEHRPFGRQPQLARLFDIRVPSPGDTYTVDVGRNTLANEAAPFASRHAASLRAIYDLADLDKSVYIHSTGQSGNLLVAAVQEFRRTLGAGRIHPDVDEAQRRRRGFAGHAQAAAALILPRR